MPKSSLLLSCSVLLLGLALTACGGDDDVRVEGTEAGDCNDGADNDGDGTFDCDDSGCFAAPACQQADAGGEDTGGEDTGGEDTGGEDTNVPDTSEPDPMPMTLTERFCQAKIQQANTCGETPPEFSACEGDSEACTLREIATTSFAEEWIECLNGPCAADECERDFGTPEPTFAAFSALCAETRDSCFEERGRAFSGAICSWTFLRADIISQAEACFMNADCGAIDDCMDVLQDLDCQ